MLRPLTVLLVLALPWLAQAQFSYAINSDNTITVTGYTGAGGAVIIPATVNSLPVADIGDFAFAKCTNMTSIAISSNIISIGESAFELCTGLTSITIPPSVLIIGNDPFGGCTNLTAIAGGWLRENSVL